MDVATLLPKVKTMLGITGTYQDELLKGYIEEVVAFMTDAGVPALTQTNVTGVVARGVSDLWNYGMGNASFSPYFMQRVAQLSYKPRNQYFVVTENNEVFEVTDVEVSDE